MKKMMRRLFQLLAIIMVNIFTLLQANAQVVTEPVAMADKLRADGKIYVVVVVLLILFLGIATYLFMLDRKISRLEKEIMNK